MQIKMIPNNMNTIQTKQEQKKGASVRFKRTPQRLAILEYLEGNTSHPSAEDIFRAVTVKYQSMSFATVYNTIHALTKAGVLRELTIDPERKRYDPDTSDHHHLICMSCGKIIDVPEKIHVELPNSMREDFTILGNHIEFYGQCSPCGKKRKLS
jgi:Fur family transcriptional regulator, peroxide stress response regulator